MLGALAALPVGAWPPGTRVSRDELVTVVVAPDSFEEGLPTWDFTLIFESDGPALMDDIMLQATLVAGERQFKPLSWEGDAPGGRERWMMLHFPAVKPRPAAVELVIVRPGERHPRVFRWNFGDASA